MTAKLTALKADHGGMYVCMNKPTRGMCDADKTGFVKIISMRGTIRRRVYAVPKKICKISGVVFMTSNDMRILGIAEGDKVKVKKSLITYNWP